MPLGIALILIFVLYLIDKHHRWRIAVKITVALIILAILGVAGVFGWQKYDEWKIAKAAAQFEAEQAKQAAENQAAFAKECKDWEDKHPLGRSLDRESIKEDGKKRLSAYYSRQADIIFDPPHVCTGPMETDYNNAVSAWVAANKPPPKPTPPVHVRHVMAKYDSDLTTKEMGDLKCGEVKTGEVVVLLEENYLDQIRVKTMAGETGWASASMFEVVK